MKELSKVKKLSEIHHYHERWWHISYNRIIFVEMQFTKQKRPPTIATKQGSKQMKTLKRKISYGKLVSPPVISEDSFIEMKERSR